MKHRSGATTVLGAGVGIDPLDRLMQHDAKTERRADFAEIQHREESLCH